jgi:(E)-4-hydroxy-3-methyl-but-2-enyl pyrophosphate reductase
MKIVLARTAGFCMGVRRAMEIAEKAGRNEETPVYTHGPLIHNAQAVEFLESQGVRAVESVEGLARGRVVIRAHGIPAQEEARLKELGFTTIDATCPRVTASQRRIAQASRKGRSVVLVGDRDHAETVGLAGHASTPVHIISSEAEAREVSVESPFCVLAQTTFNAATYARICAILRERDPSCTVYDSICRATAERQQEARELAADCDALVVVGGRHSANTCRLAEIAREAGKAAFHVESAEELDTEALAGFERIGVTAGASTPAWVTETVIDRKSVV